MLRIMTDCNSMGRSSARLSRRGVLIAGLGLALGCTRRQAPQLVDLPPEALQALPYVDPRPAMPAPRPGPTAAPAGPAIVPRARWTTALVGRNCEPMGAIERITLHHTGEHLSSTGIDDLDLIRRIENHHRVNLGWAAIGYHYLIGSDGTIYEGRPPAYQGAHCGGNNNIHNLGITLIGEFDQRLPVAGQLKALRALLEHTRHHHAIARSDVFGHRDLRTTICPGDKLYAWLQRYRRADA